MEYEYNLVNYPIESVKTNLSHKEEFCAVKPWMTVICMLLLIRRMGVTQHVANRQITSIYQG